jgi:hypothetical protein
MNRSMNAEVGAIDLNRPLARIVAVTQAGGLDEPPLPADRDQL